MMKILIAARKILSFFASKPFFDILFRILSVPDTSRLVIKRRTIAQAQSDLVQKIGELESISEAILVGNVTRLKKIMKKIGFVSNDHFALCR